MDRISYSETFSSPESEVLKRLNRETHLTQVYPRMIAGHLQGLLLKMISRMIRPERILEIGSFTGYSAICLAAGLSSGELHTIESNPELTGIIRKFLEQASLSDRVTLHCGDAMTILPLLSGPWDLVYLDADKPRYPDYYQLIIPQIRPGGFLLADNVLWGDKVLNQDHNPDKDTLGIIRFNQMIRDDPEVEQLLLPFRDGLMIIRKKCEDDQLL